MRRGSSGADVVVLGDDRVLKRKFGDTRIAEQGAWLQKHASPVLPVVHQVYAESYIMERLAVPPVRLLDHEKTLYTMIGSLRQHVWSKPPLAPPNHDMLLTKLEHLIETYEMQRIWTAVYRAHGQIRWQKLHRCLTHGDPTFDNVMIREATGELVLVDPIPATLIVPDMRCVDVGKLLQSALGWEALRYGDPYQRFVASPSLVSARLLHGSALWPRDAPKFDDNEWQASVFWCVVHLLRTLPYVDDRVRAGVRSLIGDALSLL